MLISYDEALIAPEPGGWRGHHTGHLYEFDPDVRSVQCARDLAHYHERQFRDGEAAAREESYPPPDETYTPQRTQIGELCPGPE